MQDAKAKTESATKAKAENVLRRYLGMKQKFRDPSDLIIKKG